jgi:hypothetical protein
MNLNVKKTTQILYFQENFMKREIPVQMKQSFKFCSLYTSLEFISR